MDFEKKELLRLVSEKIELSEEWQKFSVETDDGLKITGEVRLALKEDEPEDGASLPPMKDLRKAVPGDIVEGAIIWYPDNEPEYYWCKVEEVLRPSDPYKAFCDQYGCRVGLSGAHVRRWQ